MIVSEVKNNLRYTKSDEDFLIKQVETGNIYDIAIDILEKNYTYEETDEKVLPPPNK